jgi:5-methylthioadenosine/S-adenosylhomocysteine deaminase
LISSPGTRSPRLRGFLLALAAGLVALAAVATQAPSKKPSAPKEKADLLIVHARVVSMDEKFSVFDPGAVAVRGGKIVAAGPSDEVSARYTAPASATVDARGGIVMPGLVNTHTHAAMALLRGIADDLPLDRWLKEHIFPAEGKNVSAGFVYDGTLLAALEMIHGGTTTFADMYYFESEAARAVDKAGLRGVLGETFIDFPVPDHKDLPETLAVMADFVKAWKGNPRITPAVAPHSTYTCSKETLLAARDFALAQGIPILIHLRETKKELADSRNASPESPVLHLASIGFFDPGPGGNRVPIVAAHGVWLDEKDRAILKQYGVALSHNPESNMKLGSGVADVAAWQRDGLTWGLGTDGPAGSNNDLDMFEAMDFAGKLAKVSKEDPTVLPARALVAAATIGGAKALGLSGKIGSLEAGKQADVILIDVANAHIQPLENAGAPDWIYSTIVYSAKSSDVTDVWVDGKAVLRQRRSTTLDERSILEKARSWRQKVQDSLAK